MSFTFPSRQTRDTGKGSHDRCAFDYLYFGHWSGQGEGQYSLGAKRRMMGVNTAGWIVVMSYTCWISLEHTPVHSQGERESMRKSVKKREREPEHDQNIITSATQPSD